MHVVKAWANKDRPELSGTSTTRGHALALLRPKHRCDPEQSTEQRVRLQARAHLRSADRMAGQVFGQALSDRARVERLRQQQAACTCPNSELQQGSSKNQIAVLTTG